MRAKSLVLIAALALGVAGVAQADAVKQIGRPTSAPVPSLAVINAEGASLSGDVLTLTGVSSNSIVFADRPVRAAGHVNTAQFIRHWENGSQGFGKDPPNATISVLGSNGTDVDDAVVVLRAPKLDGTTLTFQVSVLEGDLAGAKGAAALFIDHFGSSFGVESVDGGDPLGNYYVDPRMGGAWYKSAEPQVGCGYYPYPPC
jgi:hypothetical protein